MAVKFKLYSSGSGWNNQHAAIKTHLGIPTGGTTEYAERLQIDNAEHPDHGKYVFTVKTTGRWKCDDQFNSSDLVDYDPDWYAPVTLEE